jgi:NNP family nitrate/nitrite transporter-like MFS transporter
LGVQAGVGNFGVSVAQFVIPWIIGLSMFASVFGASQTFTKDGKTSQIFLQNAALIWAPFIVVAALMAWFGLKSVPTAKASLRQQTDIFKNKHTWLMTSLYIMTFGSFSGFSAAFPLMIKELYTHFPGGPDPLHYAFLGPLVGAASRVVFGPVSDKLGGAKVTQVSGIGLLLCALAVTKYVHPTGLEEFGPFLWLMLGIFFFSGIGNASTFKQMPMIFEARQAGGVIGWTSAIAAYGPFFFSVLIGASIKSNWTASFFYGVAAFYLINLGINAYFYARKGAEKPC